MNEEQIELWNGVLGEIWAARQKALDTAFRRLDDALFSTIVLMQGMHVLDIGCGCGTTTLRLAEFVGNEGLALGIDISKPMLEVAKKRARAINSSARFLEADAAMHHFGEQRFDVLFSRFGVMFFSEPVKAFSNLHRVMQSHGSLSFLCWGAAAENEWAAAPLKIAQPYLNPLEVQNSTAPALLPLLTWSMLTRLWKLQTLKTFNHAASIVLSILGQVPKKLLMNR